MLFIPQTRLIPLFLGADLYSDTDIRIENHPRYHAKFAKKGLATKLVFSSGESIFTSLTYVDYCCECCMMSC